MDVHKTAILAVFDAKQRLEVPLFQRQYVWSEEAQWLPLWEDIERKFSEALDGRKDAPNHFLGAMVLDQKQTPTGHVVVRQVIDGQQRLTTLQIFLAAYRDFCREQNCSTLADECEKFLSNTGMMADPAVDKFKVWPTQLDRTQFSDIITSGSRTELLKRPPERKKPYARKPEPRPRMVQAYLFFLDKLSLFFLGTKEEPPLASNFELSTRVDECFQTLRNALMVVVIDLQRDDDPQVIFETLNARGEPLLPADLLRNFIFFRASRSGLDIEKAYQKYWARFDDEFWRQEVKQGRLVRPRSDLFMQHFLASWQGQDIPIKHLYVEYRHWLETAKPFSTVEEELATLARQGDHFRRIVSPTPDDMIYQLATFLEAFDIRTAYPLLLSLLDMKLDGDEWLRISKTLESYLVRRSICNLTTKNYNRIFLSLTRNLRDAPSKPERIREQLSSQEGESSVWPSDHQFKEAWLQRGAYGPLNSPRLVHILSRLNQTFMSPKAETLEFSVSPTVEHIMPQKWEDHWPLPDGSKGLDFFELLSAPDSDQRASLTRNRNETVDTMGNLTILSSPLNSAQSNLPWKDKRPEMLKHSLLPINQRLLSEEAWNEESIHRRGSELFERAVKIWAR